MGIESDQLVYDYLSRVGDLAQQRQLPASERMRLVSTLRNEIDRRRATYGEESPAAVRRILGTLGTPDEVVERAEGPGAAPAPSAPAPVPKPREEGRPRRGAGRAAGWLPGSRRSREGSGKPKSAPRTPAPGAPAPVASVSGASAGAGAPATSDLTGLDATGGLLDDTSDWWQQEDPAEGLPGFVGGVERPDLFEEPVPDEDEHEDGEGDEEDDAEAPSRGRRLARVLLRRKPRAAAEAYGTEEEPDAAPVSRLRLANPFVLLAALLLLGGALIGSPVVLALGWLLAYGSRRLTPGEVKAAVLVIPGLAAASGVVWLWGRVEGRWGDPVGAGGEAMGAAVSETWPWALRGAAVASALFLIWRSRR
ncbi:hypothetical protein [Streptomyces venezuelae]|uniref:hypothetical protein n=1 Tax=Streptomyces venezuelae TaxID=54571 RepID=UPI0036261608